MSLLNLKKLRKFVKKFEAIIITILASLIFYLFSYFSLNIDFLDPIENTISDIELTDLYFSKFRGSNKIVDSNIVLINFAELDRLQIAKTVEKISAYSPSVIAIDAFFSGQNISSQDSIILNIFSHTKNLVLVSVLKDELEFKNNPSIIRPYFSKNIEHGYANLKEDGAFRTIRNFKPFTNNKDLMYPAFSTKIVELYSNEKYFELLQRDNSTEVINYLGDRKYFYNLSAKEILTNNDQNLNFLKNKIIILGYLGKVGTKIINKEFEDRFYTPTNRKYVGRGEPDMFGVVIHANIVSMILNSNYILPLSKVARYILTFILIYINTFFFLNLYKRNHDLYSSLSKVIIVVESLAILFISFLILHYFNIKIELKPILISIIFLPDIIEAYKGFLKKIKVGI